MTQYNLLTAEDIYRAVLDGIKRESTAVLLPDGFNRLINDYALLMWLKERAGDGDYDQSSIDALRNLMKSKFVSPNKSGEFKIPQDYYRLYSVSFYVDGQWYPSKRLPYDLDGMIHVNPYRKSGKDRLYYNQEGDYIMSVVQDESLKNKITKARLYYLSYPKPIIFIPGESGSNGNLTRAQNKELVDIAVRVYVERVKEERYQTVLMEDRLSTIKST